MLTFCGHFLWYMQMNKTILIFLLSLGALTACKDKTTQLKVITTFYDGAPVSNVEIIVSAGVVDTGQLVFEERSDITNAEGEVNFDFTHDLKPGQSGFVAAEVYAIYNGDTTRSTVDIYQEQRNEITLLITP